MTSFSSIPSTIRPHEYDRAVVMRLIHQCMGLPASPPVSTDESEVENDSPPLRSKSISQPVQYQLPVQIPSVSYQQPVIRIDEYTMQLHFTPFYFRK